MSPSPGSEVAPIAAAEAEAVAELIERLGLGPHPEGGYYRETFRAPQAVDVVDAVGHHRTRAASTAIYFLLPATAFSALHRVSSDEVWHHYAGQPVTLYLFVERPIASEAAPAPPRFEVQKLRLGPNVAAGELPQAVVPAGVYQATVADEAGYALCGCTVAPGFDFADFEMPGRAALLGLFPEHAALVLRLTRDES